MLFNIHLYSNKIVYTRIKRYLILTVFYPKTSAHLSISLIISLKFSEISDFKTTKQKHHNKVAVLLFSRR